MRTVIVGNRKLARHLLRHTLAKGWNVVGAVVPDGKLASKQANFVPFSKLVSDTNCRLHETEDINSSETFEWLQELNPDLCLCGGWSQIIKPRVLNVPDRGFLGFHSSRLPEGRGGAPVNWNLIDGADEVWISLFYYEAGVDAGDVITQGSVPVTHRDDVATVFDALASKACQLLSSVRRRLETDSVSADPQTVSNATYRPRRQPQDGLIDWARDPDQQYDWVRAQTDPYPGAYTFYSGERLIVWECEPVEVPEANATPGEVIDVVPEAGIDVRTGGGTIRLTRVKPGESPSRWADRYAHNRGLSPGDKLGQQYAPDDWCYTGIRGPEHPTNFETNLTVGDRGELTVVSLAASEFELSVSVVLNDAVIFETTTTVSDAYRETVGYEPTEPGTHSVTVRFDNGDNRIDTRYLKVFVHE
ncbi:methionyl-tRNA formyltransferase [Halobellus ordinarius]|uniref:methionyl-tRNA formyltransferase n=1 Tax=Halobellus ordinarius TaxID=3075120 RepID=UPI002880B1AD|nr:methionyl-tRNA formyltransferase [Halobellus sp. ZY16]